MAEIISSDQQDTSNYTTSEKNTSTGTKYEVGRPAGSDEASQAAQPDSLSFPAYFNPQDVNWRAGQDWQNLVPGTFYETTGISRWRIDVGGFIYKYKLTFTCDTAHDYFFKDATGDSYEVSVSLTGDHYVNYNSSNPTITQVSMKFV